MAQSLVATGWRPRSSRPAPSRLPYEYKPGVIIEPTGKSYACHYAIFFKVLDGLITEYRFYEDASFITQLGIDASSIRLNT
jgi:hypothetical protein